MICLKIGVLKIKFKDWKFGPLFSPFYQDPLMDMLNSAAATTAHGYIST